MADFLLQLLPVTDYFPKVPGNFLPVTDYFPKVPGNLLPVTDYFPKVPGNLLPVTDYFPCFLLVGGYLILAGHSLDVSRC